MAEEHPGSVRDRVGAMVQRNAIVVPSLSDDRWCSCDIQVEALEA
jgi:hypothetical protein